MKWLDNAINKIVDKIEIKINGFENILSETKSQLEVLKLEQDKQNVYINSLEQQLKDFIKNDTAEKIEFMNSMTKMDDDIHALREITNIENKKIEESLVNQDKKIRADISQTVINSGINFFEKIKLLSIDAKGMEDRIKFLEELKDRLDDGIILMTKQALLKLIEQKIEVFEGNISNKMSGLMIYVNDKTSGNGKIQDTELLKKLARLEGIKENAILKRKEFLDLNDNQLVGLIDSILGGE